MTMRFWKPSVSPFRFNTFPGGVDDVSFLYLARHKPSLEIVSLKYTDLSLSPDSEFVEELIKSTQNSVLLRHANILPYLVTFIDNEHLWSVTQPMHFGSCRLIMKNQFQDGFSEAVVAAILKEVLKALLYMHSNHIIHK
jgi:serine/threonine protein kinase